MDARLQRRLTVATCLILMVSGIVNSSNGCFADHLVRDEKPRVLIIGDSISLGYTPDVVKIMQEEAIVRHHKGNAQHTATGLARIDQWLGDEQWDVIHFKRGLWDLCYRNPESPNQGNRDKEAGSLTTTLDQYAENLEALVIRLKQTNAKLIWASTTVVPEGEAGRRLGDDLRYNKVAADVMQKHGVRINDLNALSRTFTAERFKKPGDVHFTPAGYRQLAEQVALSIRDALSAEATRLDVISTVMFGSCAKQENPMPIFQTIADQQPEVFVFLGDNIYGDTEDMNVLRAKYAKLAADPGFQQLRSTCPVLATWDDHDYGVNDGGADYPMREASEEVFEEFWHGDSATESRSRPGIYDAYYSGPPGKRLQIILLDTRYFRSPLKAGKKRVGGSWVPDPDPAKTMLGDAQWNWLEEELRQPADVRIIASSIQCVAEDAGQETWSNLPHERQRLFDLIAETGAEGVLLISGDRHWSELSKVSDGVPYPLYELTSSSFNQLHPRGTPTTNRYRILPKTYHRENFGVIHIDWKSDAPSITVEIRDLAGDQVMQQKVR